MKRIIKLIKTCIKALIHFIKADNIICAYGDLNAYIYAELMCNGKYILRVYDYDFDSTFTLKKGKEFDTFEEAAEEANNIVLSHIARKNMKIKDFNKFIFN